MKTLLTKLSMLTLVLMMGLASCTEEDPIGGGTNNVDSLSATALSSTSIGVRWAGFTANDQVVVTPVGGGSAVTVNSANGSAVVTGLTLGTTYTIKVTNTDGESGTLTWAPAKRYPSEANKAATVRLYNTAAPINVGPSGLIFNSTEVRAVSTETADSVNIDVVLGTGTSTSLPVYFVSPGVLGSGITVGKQTTFGDNAYLVQATGTNALDNDYYSAPITTLFTQNLNSVDFESRVANLDRSLITLVKTSDNHYARIEAVPQANGQLFGQQGAYYFVDLRISYQTIVGAGYVGRPVARGTWAPKPMPSSNIISKN